MYASAWARDPRNLQHLQCGSDLMAWKKPGSVSEVCVLWDNLLCDFGQAT